MTEQPIDLDALERDAQAASKAKAAAGELPAGVSVVITVDPDEVLALIAAVRAGWHLHIVRSDYHGDGDATAMDLAQAYLGFQSAYAKFFREETKDRLLTEDGAS